MIRKSREEILRPYVVTILITVLVSMIFGYILRSPKSEVQPDKEKGLLKEKKAERDSTKEGFLLQRDNVVLPEDIKQPSIQSSKYIYDTLIERQDQFMHNTNTEIAMTIEEAQRYLTANRYESQKHQIIYYKLKYLYAVPGLTNEQNFHLRINLKNLEVMKQNIKLKSSVGEYHKNKPVTSKIKFHRVKPGETLYNISKKYNITEEYLKLINKLEGNTIIAGDSLRLNNE